jgi:hypothetical protein
MAKFTDDFIAGLGTDVSPDPSTDYAIIYEPGGGVLRRVLINNLGVTPHAVSHGDAGSDEVDVTGLSGLLADPQTPDGHHVSHENGGSDEIDVTGLTGAGGGGGGSVSASAFASRPAAGTEAAIWYSTEIAGLMSIDDGAAWIDFYKGIRVTLPPTLSTTWFNQGSSTYDDSKGVVDVAFTDPAAERGRGIGEAVPFAGNKFRIQIVLEALGFQTVANNAVGVMLGAAAGSFRVWGFGADATEGYVLYTFNSSGVFSSGNVTAHAGARLPRLWFVEIKYDGTNRVISVGTDFEHLSVVQSEAWATTFTPDRVGVGSYMNNAVTNSIRVVSWEEIDDGP